jgi:hypothetical protein
MRYYRITFRGVVSLLSDIDDARDRRGRRPPQPPPRPRRTRATATTTTTTTTTTRTMATRTMADDPEGRWSPGDGGGNSGMYVGHGEVVATRAPVIVIPLPRGDPSPDDDDDDGGDRVMNVIRVDSILTGGYAADAAAAEATRPVIDEGGGAHPGDNAKSVGSSRERRRHYGYLLLSDPRSSDRTIAKRLSASASASLRSSCERGSFVYRVVSGAPVSILSGPSVDSVGLGMALLPGTVHEVSLRISVPLSPQPDDDDDGDRASETLVDDADAGEVRFLRLGQRRGWVADRRIDATDSKLRVSYQMQDVTNEDESRGRSNHTLARWSEGAGIGGTGLVDASLSMSFEDTSSIRSSALYSAANASFYSSILASSVLTPTTVKSQRRRNRRRPRAGGGMERTQPLELTTLVREYKRVGESFEDQASSITCGDVSTSGEGDHSSLLPAQHRPTKSFYLMRVLAPLGLKILDAPHFQVRNECSIVLMNHTADSNH